MKIPERKKKIVNKDYVMSYEDAIGLSELMEVKYVWISMVKTPKQKLFYIELPSYSYLKFDIV